jgi:hypothetical protein
MAVSSLRIPALNTNLMFSSNLPYKILYSNITLSIWHIPCTVIFSIVLSMETNIVDNVANMSYYSLLCSILVCVISGHCWKEISSETQQDMTYCSTVQYNYQARWPGSVRIVILRNIRVHFGWGSKLISWGMNNERGNTPKCTFYFLFLILSGVMDGPPSTILFLLFR